MPLTAKNEEGKSMKNPKRVVVLIAVFVLSLSALRLKTRKNDKQSLQFSLQSEKYRP